MRALEHEIIERFRLLDREAKQRVQVLIAQEIADDQPQGAADFDMDRWLAQMDAIRVASGEHTSTASEMLNEIREERDADILRSIGFRDTAGDSTD
jgi:hypothetical protein